MFDPKPKLKRSIQLLAVVSALVFSFASAEEIWRGLTVRAEDRCSPYVQRDYSYPASVEQQIVEGMDAIYCPYTGRCMASIRQTDIEHVVARSEGHDSGLCAASVETRRAFARDLENLTLATPQVNRHRKRDLDAGEWLPEMNRCWFAGAVVGVKRKYGLSVDPPERDALEAAFSECADTPLAIGPCPNP